jgi:hypothetical protein
MTNDETVARMKLAEMRSGKRVILSDKLMDIIDHIDPDARVYTAVNVNRLGVLDAYVGWTEPSAKPKLFHHNRPCDGMPIVTAHL